LRAHVPLLRGIVFVACLLPVARLVALGLADALGANPVEFVTRSTGTWTLVLICATLAVTPLRRLTGWHALLRVRRMLGLFAFAHASLHLLSYVWFDQWFDWLAILVDIVKRPFVTVGFAAWLLMLPLAVTSTDAMIRRLGRRWSELHRAIYAIAVLAVLHFVWHKAGKNDFAEPSAYGVAVALLLAWRLWWHWRVSRRG